MALLLRALFFFLTLLASIASALTTSNTILVFARDVASAYSATSGFNGYGIPYQLVLVPQAGVTLPALSTDSATGNYGGIVVLSEVAYSYATGWASAFTAAQWQQLYDYQAQYGARMVRLDVFPTADFGTTTAIGGVGCCNTGVEQYVSISNSSAFPTADLKTGATMSTSGLWHYPATITNTTLATEVAQFAPSSGGTFSQKSTAAVINTFTNRQQMVWFCSWATDWSPTSTFLQHAYIHWLTRGLFVGRRRVYLSTQVDDVHLSTELYSPAGTEFRIRPNDLAAHITWMKSINSRMPAGSSYFVELGHNGNGDIESAVTVNDQASRSLCTPDGAIEYADQVDTALEYQKALGSGTNIWPDTPTTYKWTFKCAQLDPLATWFMNLPNRDAFAHVSHTFSHMSLNNATYSDANKEISFNVAWMKQISIQGAKHFSPKGLIPPAITGLHNGDAIRAWMTNGITAVVGDNTRPVLMNPTSEFWPLISNVSSNGYAGLVIVPRWATTIYYNCDLRACTTLEWVNTSGGSGNFAALLANAVQVNSRHLLGLHQDPFMFHQANLRQTDVPSSTVGGQSGKLSLLMIWVESVVQEMTRLTTWPILTLKHDDIAAAFVNRMALDKCKPNMAYTFSGDGKTITAVTVMAAGGNKCSVPIPVTFPGTASTTSSGTTSEQVGSDPLTIWATLSGSPVTFTLGEPVSVMA